MLNSDRRFSRPALILAMVVAGSQFVASASDEFSSGDKLRTLYSNHFTFTDSGFPKVTIEIMGGQSEVVLESQAGLVVQPDGPGGAQISGPSQWKIHLEDGKAAHLREWTVVERFAAKRAESADRAVAKWKERGKATRTFEIGTIFAVQGKVLDTREILVAVDPVARGRGDERARDIASEFDVKTSVHTELVRRPKGTIVARNGSTEIRNPSVIHFAPKSSTATIRVKDVISGGGGSQTTRSKEDREYFGEVYVTVGSDGKLTAVNAVAADKLLSGLVPSEMFPDSPMEALQAQTIAARTELLQKLGGRHFGDPFLLCSSQHCQVYSGAGHEHPRTTSAVARTRGLVLIDANKKLVDSRYSATCGGHSEHNENVWGGDADPVLRGHIDHNKKSSFARGITERNVASFLSDSTPAFCAKTKFSKGRYRWNATLDASQLNRRVAQEFPKIGKVVDLIPEKRGVSGRVIELRIKGQRGDATVHGELRIRRLLGGLRSSLVTIATKGPKSSPTAFVFRGAGFGHGVGMCQLGAIGMASSSFSHLQILRHYYQGSSLHRLY